MLTGQQVIGTDLSADAGGLRQVSFPVPTISSSVEVNLLAPVTGTIATVRFTAKDALATSDTNYITLALRNRTQSKDVLATTPAGTNTTKATGGAAIAAYTPLVLNANTDGTHNACNRNDVLSFSATVTGTLANSVTEGCLTIGFVPSD
jgi:hypothetical protein